MSTPGDDGFLSRWSKRKLDGAPEEELVEEAPPPEPVPDYEGKSDEEILEALELPDPETLKAGDDFKAFMNSAVPTRLRNRALRKLWGSNPVLANLDELLDYGEDFTDAATVVENLQTAYQVGRGFVIPEKDEPEEADESEALVSAEENPETDTSADEPQPLEDAKVAEPVDVEQPVAETPELALANAPLTPVEDLPPPRLRRMRFHFEG